MEEDNPTVSKNEQSLEQSSGDNQIDQGIASNNLDVKNINTTPDENQLSIIQNDTNPSSVSNQNQPENTVMDQEKPEQAKGSGENQNNIDQAQVQDNVNAQKVDNVDNIQATSQISEVKVYCFGSAECDQFKIDGKRFETRRPFEITSQFTQKINIHSVACGGLHTLLLSTEGKAYSLGCNDDGALGRDGPSEVPGLVALDHPVDMISAGDSHSIACNSTNSIVYYWGVYRNTLKGNISQSQKPHLIGEKEFKHRKISKILSGANHSMVLIEGKLYAWGDSDTGVLGRISFSRRKLEQGLRIESMAHGIEDIYTGGYHAFFKRKLDKKTDKTGIYAWGLNNYGQLGIGNTQDTHIPQEILEFRDLDIVDIVGGEHHSIALTKDGKVYAFGKNDSGQLGLGEDYEQPEQKEEKEKMKMEIEREENTKTDNPGDIKKPSESELEKMREKIQNTFKYVHKPTLINSLDHTKIVKIFAGSNFNYAINDANEIYSWGVGDNYILGTREEDTVYEPNLISKAFFKNEHVYKLGLGSQHVAFLALISQSNEPQFNEAVFAKIEEPVIKSTKKSAAPSQNKALKDKANDEDNKIPETVLQQPDQAKKTDEPIAKETKMETTANGKDKKNKDHKVKDTSKKIQIEEEDIDKKKSKRVGKATSGLKTETTKARQASVNKNKSNKNNEPVEKSQKTEKKPTKDQQTSSNKGSNVETRAKKAQKRKAENEKELNKNVNVKKVKKNTR